jgi:hypothetical protein
VLFAATASVSLTRLASWFAMRATASLRAAAIALLSVNVWIVRSERPFFLICARCVSTASRNVGPVGSPSSSTRAVGLEPAAICPSSTLAFSRAM